jgi:adenylate cyclase
MPQEIERKFLLSGDSWRSGPPGLLCRQGYLISGDKYLVRVRVPGNQGFLAIKGRAKGLARPEYEYEIPVAEARELLDNLCGNKVEKYRYIRKYKGKTWEIDEFIGANKGLMVAELELSLEGETVAVPAWVGAEITHDRRYSNFSLAKRPYRRWPKIKK